MSQPDVAGFLSALQLSDSAFPSGRYTLSYGLEAFAQSGELGTPVRRSTLISLLSDSIRFGVAPSDGVALACAHRALDDGHLVTQVDKRLTAVKIPREARESSRRTGRALLDTAIAVFDAPSVVRLAERVHNGRSPGNHAVAFGVLSAALGVSRVEAVAAELFTFSAGWASAAVRLGLIDHRTAQALLDRVRPVTAAAALEAADGQVAQIRSCTPLLDVMSMRHEQAELRLFAS
jgi:urease accessory protein